MSGRGLPARCRTGEAVAQREPELRFRKRQQGRRVGTTLPTELYVEFKVHVARRGTTGEAVLIEAIRALLASHLSKD